MWVDVELKNSPADPDWDPDEALVGRVVDLLLEGGWEPRGLLTSFNPNSLEQARRLAPGLPTGLLLESGVGAAAAAQAAAAGHLVLLPHAAALAGEAAATLAAATHREGIRLITWTVDDPAEAARLAAAGLDGIITNRPDAVRSALGEHHDHYGG